MTPDIATEYGALVHRKTTGCGDDSPCSRRFLHAHAWRYASVSNACQEGTWRDGVVPQKTLLSFTDIPKSQTLIPLKSQKTERYCWRTQKCRNVCLPHAFFEGQKAWETCARKGTARTLKEIRQQYSLVFPRQNLRRVAPAADVGAAASPDARWYRSSPTGCGLPRRGNAHNTLVQAVSDRPATHVELADLHRGKSPCLISSDCAHSTTPRTVPPARCHWRIP